MKILKILGLDLILSKTMLRVLFTLISPLLFWTVLIYSAGIMMCFVMWELPERWYFPFIHGNPITLIIDRVFLLFGIILVFIDPFKNNNYGSN